MFVLYGNKVLEPIQYTLRRIKVKPTLFNWFPKDEGVLECEFSKMTGDYEELLRISMIARMNVRVIE